MNPHYLLPWDREEAEGIIVSEILLSGGGQAGYILQDLDVFRSDARLLEFTVIKGNVLVNLLCHALEPAKLQLLQLLSPHELILWLPVVHFYTLIEFDFLCAMLCHERKHQGISSLPAKRFTDQ